MKKIIIGLLMMGTLAFSETSGGNVEKTTENYTDIVFKRDYVSMTSEAILNQSTAKLKEKGYKLIRIDYVETDGEIMIVRIFGK